MPERDESEKREMPFDNELGEIDERGIPIRNERRGNLLENVVNSAANEAANIMSQKRPRFSKQFILRYMNQRALTDYATKVAPYLQEGKISPEEAYSYLASHIVSGEFLTEEGREMILESGLEKEAQKWGGVSILSPSARKARKILKGEKYLDEAMGAFRDIYNLITSDENYAKHMPELSQAVMALYELGFRDVTLTALRKRLPKNKYMAAKLGIAKASEHVGEYVQKTLSNYFSQSVAAAVLAILGIIVLFTTNSITGNVIGTTNNSNIPALIFGAFLFIAGIFFIMRIKHS